MPVDMEFITKLDQRQKDIELLMETSTETARARGEEVIELIKEIRYLATLEPTMNEKALADYHKKLRDFGQRIEILAMENFRESGRIS